MYRVIPYEILQVFQLVKFNIRRVSDMKLSHCSLSKLSLYPAQLSLEFAGFMRHHLNFVYWFVFRLVAEFTVFIYYPFNSVFERRMCYLVCTIE